MTAPDPSRATTRAARRKTAARSVVCGFIGAGLLTLIGCTQVSGGVGEVVKLAIQQHRTDMPTPEQVAANPYYQMYVRTRTGQAVLILGNLDGDREAWYGSHGVVVFLRHGQVVKTTGLPQNMAGLRQAADNPFARGLQHLTEPTRYTFHVNWMPGYRYDVPVTARLVPRGISELSILGQVHKVILIDAHLDAPAAHWHAQNRYWVDADTGLVWKSEQQVAPGESITLVQLKPYTGALP